MSSHVDSIAVADTIDVDVAAAAIISGHADAPVGAQHYYYNYYYYYYYNYYYYYYYYVLLPLLLYSRWE